MQMIKMTELRYNPQIGAFEARVEIERDGTIYRYPCQVAGPVDMDTGLVRASLARNAMRMSDSGGTMRSVRPFDA